MIIACDENESSQVLLHSFHVNKHKNNERTNKI
jgi:hypothetical protein